MTCEELRPEYGAYSLGAAEDPEKHEITEHLERNCPECMAGVRSALATVVIMSGATKSIKPPRYLRSRVVAMVTPGGARRGFLFWLPWVAAAVLAVVLVSVALPGRFRKPAPPVASEARFNEMLSVLNDPATKDVSFGDPAARGRFFVSPSKGVVFIAAHLPKLDAGRTFEMWVIPANGKPIPAGTFNALDDSTAVHTRFGPLQDATAMAISVEPSGGSQQPTTTPIIVTRL